MKKIILPLLIFCTSAFGYYSSEAFIDLLVQPNQLRVRTDRVGVLFGNENIRAAIGLTGANSLSGIIVHNVTEFEYLNNSKKGLDQFVPAALAGIGYKMGIFGIGLGYEFKWKSPTYMVHTPVLSMTALDNTFRINIPVSVGVGQKSYYHPDRESLKGTMVISTGIEARYYFNTILNHLRFYFNYGNSTIKEINNPSTNFTQQSVGFQLRAYFNYDLSDYKITPIIRFQFDTALATRYKNIDKSYKIVDNYFITAKGFSPTGGSITEGHYGSTGANANLNSGGLAGGYIASIPNTYYAEEPYRIGIALPVGFRTVSESGTIELYVEPALSLTIVNAKRIYSFSQAMQGLESLTEEYRRKSPFYTFGYVVYGELYIRPRPRLEWYTEIQTGGATVAGELANTSGTTSLIFNASTGITWYF
ncbi:cell surface protein [Brachyspira aalborgi]|uniref:cell surface protein n=1 Tax=Brachyspira aalborgi TaxID=29522 RepID=UPI0011C80FF8|nr:cell surface protein [Brachyspira aalborgi]TXJ16430.1 cell surface protein [Brachyspira aalborgi]TXJ22011.1 cell surface protein [Brachyspira aalborgi]